MHHAPRATTDTWSGPTNVRRRPRPLPPAPPPPEQLGGYVLEGLLGEGGMAQVFYGRHAAIDRPVAIKRLAPELADVPEARALFLREARIVGAVRHAGVVEVFDFGYDAAGRPYFVMELARGTTLAQCLSHGALTVTQALEIGVGVTEAVAAVHRAGYVHRDVKGENVVLSDDGRRYVPKLIDFGIARGFDDDDTTIERELVGTPRIMAPEQVARERVDRRTDVWGIGVLLYEMVAARPPFAGGATMRDDLLAVVTEAPRPLPESVPYDLAALIGECLNKDPDDRPPTAEALLEELRWVQGVNLTATGLTARRWQPPYT